MILYSLIIPAYNSESTLPRVLPPLAALGEHWEVIIVDDCSCQSLESLVLGELPTASYYCSQANTGPAGARNYGASLAQGRYLCFLDSDVVVEASTLEFMMEQLVREPYDGVFGCYSASVLNRQCDISRFRNLLHRFVHHRCAGEVSSFWTGLGAISREAFESVGGFDERLRYLEDVELGARVSAAGFKVFLDPEFQGVHLKNWTWASMVSTDILKRAAPWVELLWKGRVKLDAMNGRWDFRVSLLLTLAILCSLALAPSMAKVFAFAYLISIFSLCQRMAQEGGPRIALLSLPALFIHHLCCWLGAVVGCVRALGR